MDNLRTFNLPSWDDIPNIPLYLDQVISLIDSSLSPVIQNEEDEPILTKTMVNNYVKHKIIDAPVKKKYSKESICGLIAICLLKFVYSMSDISVLLHTSLSSGNAEDTYKQFCTAVSSAVECTFDGRPFTLDADADSQPEGYPFLMQNVAQSLASKFYILNYCRNIKTTEPAPEGERPVV